MSPGKVNMFYKKNIRRTLSKSEKQVSYFRYTVFMMMIIRSRSEYLLHKVGELEGNRVTRVSAQMPSPM